MPPDIHVTCSDTIPDSWHVMRDAAHVTKAIVMLQPVFRVIYGDVNDDTVVELQISVRAMARHAVQVARMAYLESWKPQGMKN